MTGILGNLNNCHEIEVDARHKFLKGYRLSGKYILFLFVILNKDWHHTFNLGKFKKYFIKRKEEGSI